MSEQTQENIDGNTKQENLEGANLFGANQPKEKDLTWTFEGRKYDLFLANKTGGIGMPILSPSDKKTVIGILSAQFAWEGTEPFFDRLDIETIDKANKHGDWTERENENMIQKNARCFSELVQRGSAVEVDELGEKGKEIPKTRAEMLAYRKVVQSDLLGLWLREVHIERWLPDGMTKFDAFLSNPTELYFTMKIGDYDNPRHLLFIETDVPSDDAISAYKSDTFAQSQNQDGDWKYKRNNEKRYRFGKKYIRSVQGAFLAPKGELEFDDSDIRLMSKGDDADLKEFLKMFNPDWIVKLAEEIAGAFDLGKK